MTGRAPITEESQPRLPRGVRLREDPTREQKLLLAPERVLKLDDIAWAIASRVDGDRTVAMIVDDLATAFDADRARVVEDVCGFLQQLSDRGFVEDVRPVAATSPGAGAGPQGGDEAERDADPGEREGRGRP